MRGKLCRAAPVVFTEKKESVALHTSPHESSLGATSWPSQRRLAVSRQCHAVTCETHRHDGQLSRTDQEATPFVQARLLDWLARKRLFQIVVCIDQTSKSGKIAVCQYGQKVVPRGHHGRGQLDATRCLSAASVGSLPVCNNASSNDPKSNIFGGLTV